jgi:hypothetical protein
VYIHIYHPFHQICSNVLHRALTVHPRICRTPSRTRSTSMPCICARPIPHQRPSRLACTSCLAGNCSHLMNISDQILSRNSFPLPVRQKLSHPRPASSHPSRTRRPHPHFLAPCGCLRLPHHPICHKDRIWTRPPSPAQASRPHRAQPISCRSSQTSASP